MAYTPYSPTSRKHKCPRLENQGVSPCPLNYFQVALAHTTPPHVSIALLLSTAKLSIHPVRFLPWLLAVYAEGETGSVSPVRGMCPLSAISDLSLFLLVVNSLSPCKVSYKDPADAASEFPASSTLFSLCLIVVCQVSGSYNSPTETPAPVEYSFRFVIM